MSFREKPRTYYFADRESAETFKGLAMRARRNGRPRLRKTLADRACGKHWERDTRHVGGYSVKVCGLGLMDTSEIAGYARECGAITAPGVH